MLRDAVTQHRDAFLDEHQVEPAKHGSVLGEEHVLRADAGLLLGQQGVVPRGEVLEVLVAAVGDRSSEVATVARLENQDRLGMIGSQGLQLGHRTRLSTLDDSSWPSHNAGSAIRSDSADSSLERVAVAAE
jgi:hypothetical protein